MSGKALPEILDDAVLTVSAVSARLGVPASTLRTWDRRYGLGPTRHAHGSHRRYSIKDVSRLEQMLELTHGGVAPGDAAKILCGYDYDPKISADYFDVAGFVSLVAEGSEIQVTQALKQISAAKGLVETWSILLKPALEELAKRNDGYIPGKDPYSLLVRCALNVAGEYVKENKLKNAEVIQVLICATEFNSLAAHMVGAAMTQNDIDVRILKVGPSQAESACLDNIVKLCCRIVVLVGQDLCQSELVNVLLETGNIEIILASEGIAENSVANVTYVRTLAATIDKVILLTNKK